MRCPSCGARNSEDATWCTQCYEDLGRHREPGVSPTPPPAPTPAGPSPAAPQRGGSPDRVHDIRQRDDTVEWRCATCDAWNVLTVATCTVCGTPRRGFGPRATEQRRDVAGTNVVVASLVLPGLGHLIARRTGTGVARALLAVLWFVGGLLIVLDEPGRAGLPGWSLLLGAAVLWVASVIDAHRLSIGDERQLLGTRGLASLVVGVTFALIVSAGVAVFVGG